MAEVKRKRGRPKKQVVLPEEILTIVQEVEQKALEISTEFKPEIILEEIEFKWDVPLDLEITFFDRNLSYELTGYRPINQTRGLDFDPNWFTEARETKRRTGHYCSYRFKTKAYNEFWKEEYRRCRNGYTVNGYTITGDHYFFLNYYLLNNTTNSKKAMAAVDKDFPDFIVSLYEYLHYLELCKRLRMNAALMKARGLGFSELNASITANYYSTCRNSTSLIVAFDLKKLDATLSKLWEELSYLNYETDLGFFKLRLVVDKLDKKKASHYETLNGLKVEVGYKSQLIGIVADSPDKVRGYRCGLIVFEEAGSFPNLLKAVILGEALLDVGGNKIGIALIGGTGGDSRGAALEGLRNVYYNPEDYGVLPYRHNFTPSGETVLTGYFLSAYSVILKPGYLDSRGYSDPEAGKAYWLAKRDKLVGNPKALVDHCAERCFTADEAFALEGENKFNKILLAELLTNIRALKKCPPIETGIVEYTYKNGVHHKDNISGVRWIPHKDGKIKILEHPIWTLPPTKDENGNIIPTPDKMKGLYVIGVDGIDIGASQTSEATKHPSDFCLVVMKRAYGINGPKIVAVYKDRPNLISDAYKLAIKLALYYNATINIEATRMGFATWARDLKYLSYFMKRPRATLTDILKGTTKLYGTPATAAIINHQTDLIAEFITDYYYDIWFEDLLDLLLRYSDEKKTQFDYVAALGMSVLADEELSGSIPRAELELKQDTWRDIGYYYDNKGVKHYGVIPKQDNINIKISWHHDDLGIKSSDPRAYEGYI